MGDVRKDLGDAPWSHTEAEDAAAAVRTGLDEISGYFANHPKAIAALGGDAVESLLDASYAADVMPDLKAAARERARAVLIVLLAQPPAQAASCKDYASLLPLAIYAHALLLPDDSRATDILERTNAAYSACGSLNAAMGYAYRERLKDASASIDAVWDMVMWSILFTDAQLVPGLHLPAAARAMPPDVWRYLQHYRLPKLRAGSDGTLQQASYDRAYLATHIAYIPTGYGRYRIFIADSPALYRFLRENFYTVLRMGELDMTAEFVDLFRQYGCSEETDLQLRDGTRYLLKLFHKAGGSWIAYREPHEPSTIGDYNAVHKAWTGMSGVRARLPQAAAPGTYGGIVRSWLDPKH